MDLAHFRMLNNELLKKDPYVVPEQALLIILDIKYHICMAKNGKDAKNTKHISRRILSVINGEECNLHRTVWCEVGLQLADIKTKNFREDKLNPRLGYAMVRIYHWQNTCQRGMTGYIILLRTMCSKLIDWIEFRIHINEFEIFTRVYNDKLDLRMTNRTLITFL